MQYSKAHNACFKEANFKPKQLMLLVRLKIIQYIRMSGLHLERSNFE